MYFYFSPHRGATERGGWPTLVHSNLSHSIASYSSAFTGGIPTVLVSFCSAMRWLLRDDIFVAEFHPKLKVPQDIPEAFDSLDVRMCVHPQDNP